MDTMYQRGKIQDESMYYEQKKYDGSLPLIGVNTFLPKQGQEDEVTEIELARSTDEEKQTQIAAVRNFQTIHSDECERELDRLKEVARRRGNCFEALMESVKHASLGQVSDGLYHVGGEYRRNM
jgi:methylmalonyl-CoA mutase